MDLEKQYDIGSFGKEVILKALENCSEDTQKEVSNKISDLI